MVKAFVMFIATMLSVLAMLMPLAMFILSGHTKVF